MKGPIRVLHILHTMNRGGTENALMNYYRHIDRNCVQFDFLLTDQLKCQFEDEILALGGKIFRVPLLRISNPFLYIKGVKAFFKTHPEYRIVHSHTSSKSVVPLFIAKQLGIPVRISHSHSSMTERGINGFIRNMLKPLIKFVATDWFTCGELAGEFLYGKGSMKKGKVEIFQNVIEANRFRFSKEKRDAMRQSLGINNDVFVIGHTARFDPIKNHKFDVDILAEIKKTNPKCKLLEVGFGVREGLFEYATQKGVIEDIIFAGVVSNVYDYEQAMDVFILPSLNEGLPLSIIEAQVSGLPCFTTEGTVSKECSVTDLVTYTPLEAGADAWAKKIWDSRCIERKDHFDEIVTAGYNAETSAIRLQEFYMRKIK